MAVELPNISGEWNDKIFSIQAGGFEAGAMDAFSIQYHHNPLYAQFADAVGRSPANVSGVMDIPFLPIQFFKTHEVRTGTFQPQAVFESSGTTGSINSRHAVRDLQLYQESFRRAFTQFYGPVNDWCVLALLPSYLERQHSSLVLMADDLIQASAHEQSGFYLYDHQRLSDTLQQLERDGQQTLLLGVSFALIDFAEAYPQQLQHTTIMETGGMKGRREEWTRGQLHEYLSARLGVKTIHSEYGMTELLSQAYAPANGIFNTPPWMRVLLRAEDDPFQLQTSGRGIVNIIDLANIYSCCFIATDDAGKLHADGSFEISGRVDHADLRGCSLMTI